MHQQKSVLEDVKPPSTMPNVCVAQSPDPTLQTVQQQVPVAQHRPLTNLVPLSLQLPLGEPILSARASTVADGQRPVRFSPLASNLLRSDGAKPDSITSSHPQKESDQPQIASILPLVADFSLGAMSVSTAVVNLVPVPLLSAVSNYPVNVVSKTGASVVADAVPGALPDALLNLVPKPMTSSVPGTAQSAIPSPVTSVASNTLPRTVLNTVTVLEPAPSIPGSGPLPSLPPTVIPGAMLTPSPRAVLNQAAGTIPATVPGVVEHTAAPVAPNALPTASLSIFPVSALHSAVNLSPKGDTAPKSSTVQIGETNPPAVLDPGGLATSFNIPDQTASQLFALLQPGGGLLVTAQVGAPGVSPTSVTKPAATTTVANVVDGGGVINDAAGLKQRAQSVSDTGSQETASSVDPSQGAVSPQGQSGVPAQSGPLIHAIATVDHASEAVVTPPLQAAPTLAGVAGHAAKTSDNPAPATIVLPPLASAINSAKLIQSIGQTEMRVGLRSIDFGNISISTSATRDLISAQILLDHGELARTLAVHLPEMQARLGGAQAMDVRIDMNGQGTGTAAGMSDGSATDGSRGERQQKGSTASSQSSDRFAGPVNSIAGAALTSGEGRLIPGLDIRV